MQRAARDGVKGEQDLLDLELRLGVVRAPLDLCPRRRAFLVLAAAGKVFLSDRDRYDLMVEKNPALDVLRKALDLDLG